MPIFSLLCTNSSTATTVAASEALALENATVPHRWPPSSVSTHRVVHHHHQASNFAEKSVGVVGPLGEHGGHVVAAASATSEAAVSTSFSCFGALCSVVRAATDYCRYGNLKQYLLIDPNTGEPLKDTIYTASHLTTEVYLYYLIHPSLDIVNEPIRPLLFTISSRSLYQGKVFL